METSEAAHSTAEQHWQDAVSSVVHELKSPTASLKTLLQTLEQRMPSSTEREIVQMCLKQTDRLTLLINDLLDVTRIERGHLTYRFEHVRISELVQSMVKTMQADHTSHTIVLQGESAAMVYADPLRIEQALINIIVNATKYSPAGSTITVLLAEEDDRVAITVKDEGIGITPEQQKHLFDLYYRAPTATSVKGLGIGLPLSYGIVKAHQGDIIVTSTAEGSTFTLYLPITRPSATS